MDERTVDYKHQMDEWHFIEDLGLFFEQMGMSRMAGKVIGALLIADPPNQSLTDLSTKLKASKGSISQTTRMLIEQGLVERVATSLPRQTCYRFRPGGWVNYMQMWLGLMAELHGITERGLVLMTEKSEETKERLMEAHDLFSSMEDQLPSVLASMEAERLRREPETESSTGATQTR
ncbi:MAG: MarR family transcriptional regulator [Anaerolineaceae bacterium]